MPPNKNFKLLIFAAEPFIFDLPQPSRASRGDGIQFEVF